MSIPSGHGSSTIADARALAAELSRQVSMCSEWGGMAAPYPALFSAQAPVKVTFSPPALPEAEVRDRLARGFPALAPEAFRADPQMLRQLWDEVCAIAAHHFPDRAPALEPIRRWPDGREDGLLFDAIYCFQEVLSERLTP